MKTDITTRDDINIIITKFYKTLLDDKNIAYFFKEFINNNTLEKHIDIITDFWEDLLLQKHNYKNNILQKHINFNQNVKFSKNHFNIWLGYFFKTIDELYVGKVSENMKNRAQSIATVMQVKMNLYTN